MKYALPYKQSSQVVEIAEQQVLAVLEPKDVSICAKPQEAVRDSIGRATASVTFEQFLSGEGRLLVIVNDGTRPTPTRSVISAIADELESADAEFIIATGAHRAPTDEELGFIFGENLERFRKRISVHDARTDPMYKLGTTSRGTEVFLNAKVEKAKRLLVIGSVEPHYFAGFTGGRKGLVPGVAAFNTIEQNHRHALSPDARVLALNGNPVHEDMLEACAMLDNNIFSIMTVLDREQNLYAVCSGDLYSAFDETVKMAKEVFLVPLEQPADIVIACAKYPMDIDLYQSQKAIEHAKLALKPGGTLILVSSCRDGVGNDAFYRLMSACETPQAVFRKIEEGYRLGYHKAAKIAEICGNARVLAFTELDDEALARIFIEAVSDIQATLDELLSVPGSRVVIMPDASVTVPMI